MEFGLNQFMLLAECIAVLYSSTTSATAVIHTTHWEQQTTVTRTVLATEVRLVAAQMRSASIQVHFHVFCCRSQMTLECNLFSSDNDAVR